MTSLILFARIPKPTEGANLEEWFINEGASTVSLVSLYLIPFSGIAFLWFVAVLRDRAGSREDRFFDTVLLGSGLLFVAMLFAGAAAYGSVLGRTGGGWSVSVDGGMIAYSRLLGFAFFNVYASRAAGVFVMVTSSLVLRTGFLPRWIAFTGFAAALVLLLGTSAFETIIYLFPAWVALISIAVLVTLNRSVSTE